MTLIHLSKWPALLVGLFFPLLLSAQTPTSLPEGATQNSDKCLGYDLEYKKYPKPVIAQVQADMYQLYHQEADWQIDASRKGKPLNDGILGPITWSWMQRFCKNFALDSTANVIEYFPERASAIAKFSTKFRDDANTLIGQPFNQWAEIHLSACDLNTRLTLAKGSDDDLQALLRCYRTPAAKPAPEPEAVREIKPHQLYVLRADDFEAMAGAVNKLTTAESAVISITGKTFPDKATAIAELTALLGKLPAEESKAIADRISAKILEQRIYRITDEVLNTLTQQGISDALFDALGKLRDKPFTDQPAFIKAVSVAIQTATLQTTAEGEQLTQATNTNKTAESSTTEQTASTQEIAATINQPPIKAASMDKLLLQIQLASQQTYFQLSEADAKNLLSNKKPVAAAIIKLLEIFQDIEYPSAELLDMAIKNKILKASGICKIDKSNTLDNQLQKLSPEEKTALFDEISAHFSNANSEVVKYCNEDHEHKLGQYYRSELLPILAPLYSEPMPDYSGEPILWDGSDKTCGCVPKQLQTTAYGIYPYWKTSDKAQEFDFSTLNRVAFFGLSASDNGKLFQINSRPGGQSLLDNNSDESKAFIREARRYGSKVDWIIEKEFSLAPDLQTDAGLKIFFDNLKNQLLQLLATPLTDAESRLRPIISLGLAAQPTNGDGVTLYFKNYPEDSFAKDRFDAFYKTLKKELAEQDRARDRWNAVKHFSYINIMVEQSEFLSDGSVFNVGHIDFLTQVNKYADDNKSIPEIQDSVKTLVVLLMEDPYYTALDEIYAMTTSTDRTIIAPLMFTDYSAMDIKNDGSSARHQIDERQKRLAYIHESFGGGSFWPMIEYANNSDGKNYSVFNSYIGKHFSPGYTESLWNETLCGYRWLIIGVMNLWLILALIYLLVVFYIFPHRCRKLPVYIQWISHPLTVISALLPPIIIWVYLIAVDPLFNIVNLSSLLGMVLVALAIRAGINSIKALKEQKPNRNLLQHQKSSALPQRPIPITTDDQVIDDVEFTGDHNNDHV